MGIIEGILLARTYIGSSKHPLALCTELDNDPRMRSRSCEAFWSFHDESSDAELIGDVRRNKAVLPGLETSDERFKVKLRSP